ncbi:MAG: Epimerase family protein [bacterium]|nr:Epimerase family protein [bacterium]
MRVFITGATGLVGRALIRRLIERGDTAIALSRNAEGARKRSDARVEWVEGDPSRLGEWRKRLEGCEAVVNLAGEPVVGRRWNEALKDSIRTSRVDATRNLAQAIRDSSPPARVFVSSSAVGYYGPLDFNTEVEETHGPGTDFLADVCKQWEAATDLGPAQGTVRKVILRIAVVLAAEGGALAKMLTPFKLGLGGRVGSGAQPFPWIHLHDLVELILWSLDSPKVNGVFNAGAPQGVTNREFTRVLARVLGRPAFFPVPAFALRLLFGDGAYILLTGQRIVPKRARELGFAFQFPELEAALRDVLAS